MIGKLKKLLLLSLCFLAAYSADAQVASFWLSTSAKYEGISPSAISSFSYTQYRWGVPDIHNVARAGEVYNGVIGLGNNYDIDWAIISVPDEEHAPRGDTIASGTGNNVIYTFPIDSLGKSYDIAIDVSWGTGSLSRYIRRGIVTVSYPVFKATDPDVAVIDVSTIGYSTSLPAVASGKNKILFTGTLSAAAWYANGWEADNGGWLVIQADSAAQVSFLNQGKFGYGCHKIILDGATNPSRDYGFHFEKDDTEQDSFVIVPGGPTGDGGGTGNYSDSIQVISCLATLGSTGFHVLPPDVGPDGPPQATQIHHIIFANCLALNTAHEGYYLGYTRDYQGYAEVNGLKVYYCIARFCGWDGFQPGNGVNVELHNIHADRCGQAVNTAQYSGISCNGFSGYLYNFRVDSMYICISGSTGRYHGNTYVFNGYLDSELDQGDLGATAHHNWFKLGDAGVNPPTVKDFFIYQVVFDLPAGNEVWGTYPEGPTTEQRLNAQFVDNTIVSGDPPLPAQTYWIDAGFTKHWLSEYDIDGYRTFTP